MYHTIFATVLVTKSFNMAGQALGSYWKETLLGIWEALPALLLLAVPLVVYFFQPRFALLNRPDGRVLLGVIGGVIIVQAAAVLAIALPTGQGIMSEPARSHRRDLCPRPDGLPLRPGHHPAAGYRADPLWPGGTQPPRPG